jgi:hypothetical protein
LLQARLAQRTPSFLLPSSATSSSREDRAPTSCSESAPGAPVYSRGTVTGFQCRPSWLHDRGYRHTRLHFIYTPTRYLRTEIGGAGRYATTITAAVAQHFLEAEDMKRLKRTCEDRRTVSTCTRWQKPHWLWLSSTTAKDSKEACASISSSLKKKNTGCGKETDGFQHVLTTSCPCPCVSFELMSKLAAR